MARIWSEPLRSSLASCARLPSPTIHVARKFANCGKDCGGDVGAEVPHGGGQGLQDPAAGCGGGEEGEAGDHGGGPEVTFVTKTMEGEGRYPKQISTV